MGAEPHPMTARSLPRHELEAEGRPKRTCFDDDVLPAWDGRHESRPSFASLTRCECSRWRPEWPRRDALPRRRGVSGENWSLVPTSSRTAVRTEESLVNFNIQVATRQLGHRISLCLPTFGTAGRWMVKPPSGSLHDPRRHSVTEAGSVIRLGPLLRLAR